MPQANKPLLAWNRGIISPLATARNDLQRHALSAEQMNNWMPRRLGSMMLRPGLAWLGATKSNAQAKYFDFVFSSAERSLLEVTGGVLRIWKNDALVTRLPVTAAVVNGSFNADVTSWTDMDEAGGVSAWIAGGYLSLIGNGSDAAIREQAVAVIQPGTEHALRIIVKRGPAVLRVGSASGLDDYVGETTLGTGTHSLAFTPGAGSFYIRFSNSRIPASLIDSVAVEAAGTVELPVPWLTADLRLLRVQQSGDVLYVAREGYQQRKIERRGAHSWSVVLYEPENGPFRIENLSSITIAASAINGDVILTASKSIFRPGHVGALFRLTSSGQVVTASLTGADQFTDPIRVTGVGGQRAFSIILTGVFVATATLQYSVGEPGSWVDVTTYTAPTSISYNDALDNQIIFYRIGVKAGNYTSGTVGATLSFTSGSANGVARITAYASGTSVSAAVLDSLGGTGATSTWSEGRWSDFRGWPSAVTLHEGRVEWFGKDRVNGSEPDNYESFDDLVEGDAAPIDRTIGQGPVDSINWGMSLTRLLLGTPSIVFAARSSSLDEPLTPTNFSVKPIFTGGSAQVAGLRMDTSGLFVDGSGTALYEVSYDTDKNDFSPDELTTLVPELNSAGIVSIAIQRRPDTRIHCVRADGKVGVLVFDRSENVACWCEVETSGTVEDVVVLPESNSTEDAVYYCIARLVGSSTVRYLERWAAERDCIGAAFNKQADAFILYSGAPTLTIPVGHLEGREVVVWSAGKDLGTFTVSGGVVTFATLVSSAVIGLGYEARYKTTRQAFAAALGSELNQLRRLGRIGLLLKWAHTLGLSYGVDFEHLEDLPYDMAPVLVEAVGDTPPTYDLDYVHDELETEMMPLDSLWKPGQNLCLRAAAPRPCTVVAATITQDVSG